jgi:hypothetical protein
MYRIIALLILMTILALPGNSMAQSFEKGNVLLSPGIGWGTRVGGSGFFWPNFTFNADFGVHEYVSVGPYGSFAFGRNGVNAFGVGARASFHWWQLLDHKVEKDLKQDQLDLYLPFWMGARIITNQNGHNARASGFDGGLGFGLRWYPNANPRFALFSEWGRGPISWGSVGATIKLN